MNSILDVTLLLSLVTHAFLAVFLLFNRIPTRHRSGTLLLALAWSSAALALEFVALPMPSGYLRAVLLALLLATYGAYVLRDVGRTARRVWLVTSGLWVLGILAVWFTGQAGTVGTADWLFNTLTNLDIPAVVILGGLALSTILLIGLNFYGFYIAALPEAANRALFWVLNTAGLSLGVLLLISGTDVFQVAGAFILLVTFTGAVYAHVSPRVFNIRLGLVAGLRLLVLIALTSIVVLIALLIFDSLETATPEERLLALVVLSVLTATAYILLRQVLTFVLSPFRRTSTSPTRAARQYSQQVSKALDLKELVAIVTSTLNRTMDVRRSGLMLVNDTARDPGRVEMIVMRDSVPHGDELKGLIAKKGPIYERLAVKKLPLSQFDIEFDPHFQVLEAPESQFFGSLQMSAYAPIVVENVLIGVLMCGPKLNDAPFDVRDLDLLATMADQTGVALRNARAMADLRHLNETMKTLNADLEEANQQFEKLDSVKTDFITIASHELRTPLAQIRGYTDILDALNEQGMLDQDQISGMVGNLRKASERTEELISAMLDMSQLDVNAMDLRFAQAAPESILRMAIEPLTEHIKQRKLTLSGRGLRGLPNIHCDMQRLVQAFRNILTNAIKFTPDGGRIDITASFQAADSTHPDHILVAISDTGVGIDRDNLDLIFEKFYRAYDPSLHSSGSYKFMGAGPGLGLTIAKGVIEGHGGQIWAESSGHNMETFPGSTFYVILPVEPPDEARRVLIEELAT
jgi:signal transduction histidine kinase